MAQSHKLWIQETIVYTLQQYYRYKRQAYQYDFEPFYLTLVGYVFII